MLGELTAHGCVPSNITWYWPHAGDFVFVVRDGTLPPGVWLTPVWWSGGLPRYLGITTGCMMMMMMMSR